MTDNRRLKRTVRARMAVTGENYTTALRKVKEALQQEPPTDAPPKQ